MSDNIKVVVKVRPLIPRETEEKLSCQWKVRNNTLYQLDQCGRESGQSFTFEKVYDINTNTSDVYNDIAKPIVEAAIQGINGTIFAYGQTSSGKTYTMSGTQESPGIIPLAVLNLFKIIKNIPDRDFLVRVSYIEIYNETLKDLLDVKKNIKIHETYQGCVKVDATEKVTSSPQEVLDAMSEGQANRQVGSTNMNEESSRSHSIFQITIESREHIEGEEESGCVNVSQLNLVDLAGSERAGQTGATGVRFKEGTHINKSLSTLALVIKQLSEDPNKFANYRDSKLTRILQNSLGGNAKTSIICAVTPAAVEETISTLQFATRAKAIRNKPEVNAVATNATMIQSLTKQLGKLQSQLESKKNLEHDNKRLNQEIEKLKSLILNGFGRPSLDMSTSSRRRTWCAPRRQTISAMPKVDEDEDCVIPDVPKFRTPSLKYNPLLPVPGIDFKPIFEFKMPSVPEEPSGSFTPQLSSTTVNFNDEIIEIDSDDDDKISQDTVNCSPYHKCYGASKTPPCVLRKNAKQAEKSFKDLMELTEIEKIYTPEVAELIEKIDDKTSMISKLQEEINTLSATFKEKELEVNSLKDKVSETEIVIEKVSSEKLELEKQCKEYVTKLTDLEFSFETLKQKYQRREQELLSRLEEVTPTKTAIILSKQSEKELNNFMDLSKEISLVHSDTESSIIQEEPSDRKQSLVTDMQSQLINKNQMILNLEESLQGKAQKISSLEKQNQQLHQKIIKIEENVKLFESENDLLRSSIENLNSTIKSQKENLETANSDLILCNNFIKELYVKYNFIENKENQCSNDNLLDSMKVNEGKIIANNENIKNIMQTLKSIVDEKDNEITSLRSSLSSSSTAENDYRLLVESKDNEIDNLRSEVENLKQQIDLNISKIDSLVQEKNNFLQFKETLTSELNKIQANYQELQNVNVELNNKLLEKETLLQKYLLSESNIQVTIEKLITLENEVEQKNELIASLKEKENKHNELTCSLESEVASLKQRITEIQENEATLTSQYVSQTEKNKLLAEKLAHAHKDLENKLQEFMELETKLNDVNERNENLRNDIVTKENTVICLREELYLVRKELDKLTMQALDISALKEEIEELRNSLEKSEGDYSALLNHKNDNLVQLTTDLNVEVTLENKDKEIIRLREEIEANKQIIESKIDSKEIEAGLTEITQRLEKDIQDRNSTLKNIVDKLNMIIAGFGDGSEGYEIISSIGHETIFMALNKITEHIKHKSDSSLYLERLLSEAREEISLIKEHNETLILKLKQQEAENKQFLDDLQGMNSNNISLKSDLVKSNELIEQLQTELNKKTSEVECIQNTTLKIKKDYLSFEILMKQQLHNMQSEYAQLEEKYNQIKESEPELKKQPSEAMLSPPSLLTICCSKILDYIQSNNTNYETFDSSSESDMSVNDMCSLNRNQCLCSQLAIELQQTKTENETLIEQLKEARVQNQSLLQEHEEVRQEIKELLEPSLDLEKKIINHRTNLCTLSATTFAENRLLGTQVKTLQHHLTRLQKICENDLPYFSKQLNNLLHILKTEFSTNCQHNSSFKRYSLPVALDRNASLRNESTLDGDLLMLDTNVTLSTSVNNTFVAQDQSTLDLTNLFLDNEFISNQNLKYNNVQNSSIAQSQMEVFTKDNEKMDKQIEILKEENIYLRNKLIQYSTGETNAIETLKCENCGDKPDISSKDFVQLVDAQISPIKLNKETSGVHCGPMKFIKQNDIEQTEAEAVSLLTQELLEVKKQKQELKEKYESLSIEIVKCENCGDKPDISSKDFVQLVDAQISPIKLNKETSDVHCSPMKFIKQNDIEQTKAEAVSLLTQELLEVKKQKQELKEKYESLSLEIPSTEALVRKINNIEKDLQKKSKELEKLHGLLQDKTKELKHVQQENDTLSTQVFENISESDDLRKEIETLKEDNTKLKEKCSELGNQVHCSQNNSLICIKCNSKSLFVSSLEPLDSELQLKQSRSFSDSDQSLRDNRILNLQKELNAGKEDCRQISENVADILNHFGHSDPMSIIQNIDGDISMDDKCSSDTVSQKNIENNKLLACQYSTEKMDCLNYLLEKTKAEKDSVSCEFKVIDIMKMLHDFMCVQHKNEVVNLNNKLRDSEEAKEVLQNRITELIGNNSNLTKKIEETVNEELLIELKKTTNFILNELPGAIYANDFTKLADLFKDEVLKVLDGQFHLCTYEIFQILVKDVVEKHKSDLTDLNKKYSDLTNHLENVTLELKALNENLVQTRSQLATKEQEFSLLKAQKERIHEISNAVTLDIVQKEQELSDIISKGRKQLLDENILESHDFDTPLSYSESISSLFENLIKERKWRNDINQEKENLILEVKNSKIIIEEKEKHLTNLKDEYDKLEDNNRHLSQREDQLQLLKNKWDQLSKDYEHIQSENDAREVLIKKLTDEIEEMKQILHVKESALQRLDNSNRANSELETKLTEILETTKILQNENDNLKQLNQILTKEKEECELELEKATARIQQQKLDCDKITANMLILKESVAENKSIVENLQQEGQTLYQQNMQIKNELEEKIRECSRLQMNIKTHEKTVEIQSGMIIRLQKQKEDDKSKDKQLEDMMDKHNKLQDEFNNMKCEIETTREQLTSLTSLKNTLETRLEELQAELSEYKMRRKSVDATAAGVRHRRQSILDSKRMFGEADDDEHKNADAIFSSRSNKPGDLFMEVDDNSSSNRSTPVRLSRGRESLSRLDHSDNSEEHSRPSSVMATRRRRQSIHDLHRSTLRNTPSPHDQPLGKVREEITSKATTDSSELSVLREQLTSCQQELEELKERFREVDEECEICAQYLRERDEQCLKLRNEKIQLQKQVQELESELKATNMKSQDKADASVNTDEDWSNLHSVVVDRMSYDVEVEKNKKLSKALEEYRFKNRDLKATLIKVQKALENEPRKDNTAYVRELEHELKACKRELEQVRARCKELDDECETCGEYLRERESQCARLKEAKVALEAQLRELQEELRSVPVSLRKKRQSHDAVTETSDDFLSHQLERDDSSRRDRPSSKEVLQLKETIDQLSAQKSALEQQLNSQNPNAVMFVATGSAIVQNQQITDVMKENHKLKKINAKLLNLCKQQKKSHSDANRENENPADKC